MTLTFTLPLPPRGLSPNARLHFRAKSPIKNDAFGTAYLGTLEALGRLTWEGDVRMSLAFCKHGAWRPQCLHRTRNKNRCPECPSYPTDADNAIASFKAYQDGIARALGIDDRRIHLGEITIDATQGPYVQVTIEALEGKE